MTSLPPPGWDATAWTGRSFGVAQDEPFSLRIERQITFGLPDVRASLFFIRRSFIGGREIRSNPLWRDQLLAALRSMSTEARVFKGVQKCFDELVAWLEMKP